MPNLLTFLEKGRIEAGCDEAGRGCLAGPVVAAAVILDEQSANDLKLDDSKKLSEKKRDALRIVIEEKALAWAVAFVSNDKIDEINILQASFLAMRQAVDQLFIRPDHILIDGNRFVSSDSMPPHTCIIKGDGKYSSIAAASILAKTHRDDFMKKSSIEFPGYGWEKNAGYPTAKHKQAVKALGTTNLHRLSFKLD
ncbi:MAG: ribonuclease HII [Crocinitomicaceae bacterium]|nr:ribonuclease HII [Crocinitomicaceae bacterium]|tara:strand:- start:4904 stop:5491 length:588 start_codon:yes stop_codon:yes gene_type:complete